MPFDVDGPQPGNKRRGNPIHTMLMLPSDDIGRPAGMTVADDMISLATQCATQWDSLAHVGYDGLLWNNVPNAAVSASGGVTRNSFDKVVSKLVGRGVLLDVAALKGVDVLGYSEEITADDLSAAAERQGVEVRSGDIVLVRTGWYRHFLAGDREAYMSQQEAGLGISCCQWLAEREVAVIACDNYAVEVKPSTEPPATHPLHMVLIRDVGMTLGEMFNMEELATTCADEGRWEFFFSGVGLKITSSAGSPITPVAIF
jgi:kynurenine formamidase